MTHHFQKGAMDYASGMLALVRSRVKESTEKAGGPPRVLVLHEPATLALFREYSLEQRVDMPGIEDAVRRMVYGGFEGVPFEVCHCGNPLKGDLLINFRGDAEDL